MKHIFLMLLFITSAAFCFGQFLPTQPAKTTKPVKTSNASKQSKPAKKTETRNDTKTIPAEEKNKGGYIVIFRGGQFASALTNYNIYVDGKKICKLSNGKYLKYPVSPGKHEIEAKKAGVDILKKQTFTSVVTPAGKTNYVSCNIKSNLLKEKLEMIEVTESAGRQYINTLKEDNCQGEINEGKNNN